MGVKRDKSPRILWTCCLAYTVVDTMVDDKEEQFV